MTDLSKETVVNTFTSTISLLQIIKMTKELTIGVKTLASKSQMSLQDCVAALRRLQELGKIIYLESNSQDENGLVLLNGNWISKGFYKLRQKAKTLEAAKLTGWLDYNFAKSIIASAAKFKLFLEVVEKAKLIHIQKKNGDEVKDWKIFIPQVALEGNSTPLYDQGMA